MALTQEISTVKIRVLFSILALMCLFFSIKATAQNKCGGLNQVPCPVSTKSPPCKKGLRDDPRYEKCVSAKSIAAFSFLKLCNNDSEEVISFLIALWDSNIRKWNAEGWFRIDDRECAIIPISANYQGFVDIYAEMKGKIWSGNAASICVPTDLMSTFSLADKADCRFPQYKRVKMFGLLFARRVTTTYYLKSK